MRGSIIIKYSVIFQKISEEDERRLGALRTLREKSIEELKTIELPGEKTTKPVKGKCKKKKLGKVAAILESEDKIALGRSPSSAMLTAQRRSSHTSTASSKSTDYTEPTENDYNDFSFETTEHLNDEYITRCSPVNELPPSQFPTVEPAPATPVCSPVTEVAPVQFPTVEPAPATPASSEDEQISSTTPALPARETEGLRVELKEEHLRKILKGFDRKTLEKVVQSLEGEEPSKQPGHDQVEEHNIEKTTELLTTAMPSEVSQCSELGSEAEAAVSPKPQECQSSEAEAVPQPKDKPVAACSDSEGDSNDNVSSTLKSPSKVEEEKNEDIQTKGLAQSICTGLFYLDEEDCDEVTPTQSEPSPVYSAFTDITQVEEPKECPLSKQQGKEDLCPKPEGIQEKVPRRHDPLEKQSNEENADKLSSKRQERKRHHSDRSSSGKHKHSKSSSETSPKQPSVKKTTPHGKSKLPSKEHLSKAEKIGSRKRHSDDKKSDSGKIKKPKDSKDTLHKYNEKVAQSIKQKEVKQPTKAVVCRTPQPAPITQKKRISVTDYHKGRDHLSTENEDPQPATRERRPSGPPSTQRRPSEMSPTSQPNRSPVQSQTPCAVRDSQKPSNASPKPLTAHKPAPIMSQRKSASSLSEHGNNSPRKSVESKVADASPNQPTAEELYGYNKVKTVLSKKIAKLTEEIATEKDHDRKTWREMVKDGYILDIQMSEHSKDKRDAKIKGFPNTRVPEELLMKDMSKDKIAGISAHGIPLFLCSKLEESTFLDIKAKLRDVLILQKRLQSEPEETKIVLSLRTDRFIDQYNDVLSVITGWDAKYRKETAAKLRAKMDTYT